MKGFIAILILLTAVLPLPAHAQAAPCQFVLGFAQFAAAVPQVGQCTENQHAMPNGDAQQATTGGLLVWRKADNWTAFTDGYRTWLNGPQGLQQRLNTERLDWEPSIPAVPAAPVPSAPPVYLAPCADMVSQKYKDDLIAQYKAEGLYKYVSAMLENLSVAHPGVNCDPSKPPTASTSPAVIVQQQPPTLVTCTQDIASTYYPTTFPKSFTCS